MECVAIQDTYGVIPTVEFKGNKTTLPYISTHLQFICFEILKNGMRAIVENKPSKLIKGVPDIEVLIAEGETQTTIRFSDTGGGIPPEGMAEVFHFGYTTAMWNDNKANNLGFIGGANNAASPMAGLGFGLPLARIYARHFGGDLELISMHGYGTDVYLRLDRTGNIAENVSV